MRTYGKLRERIRLRFGVMSDFASAIGISRSALSQKLNGSRDWSRSEIESVCKSLDIPIEQVGDYFFYEI